MYCWQSPTTFLYSESLTPHFGSQPDVVYSTPGLGHIVQDFAVYVPLPKYSADVKEVEKQLNESSCTGGLEFNPPLLGLHQKKKSKQQKGHGKTTEPTDDLEDHQIAQAFEHPIKVQGYKLFSNIIRYILFPLGQRG